jgi:RHS repeat-associated protein
MYRGGNTLGARDLGNKHYELGNHLGNVLAVVTDNIHMADDLTTATVASASDYYPFGMQMDSRTVNDGDYRYGFNGKEKDQNEEFGNTHYDYGFRIYNPAIAKFLSVDPLTRN